MVLVMTLLSSTAIVELPVHAWRITLIAPAAEPFKPGPEHIPPPSPRPSQRVREYAPRELQATRGFEATHERHATREFRATVAHSSPTRLELTPIPTPETPQVFLPTAQLPRVAPVAPRSPKLDNFADLRASAPDPAPARIRQAGFSSIKSAERVPSRPTIARPTGSFDSASVAVGRNTQLASAHASTAQLGQFSDISTASNTPAQPGTILRGGFGDSSVAPSVPNGVRKSEPSAAATAVEILFKPRPLYTAEARALQIEGEVLLEMQFDAEGDARMVRVVRGLGHGLDETAIAAARGIRFRPAERNGAPIDSAAIVHIVFQLAY